MSSDEKRISASARVQVTLEVLDCGSWGPTCTVEQVHKQAKETAVNQVEKLVREGKVNGQQVYGIRVLGNPVVTGVFSAEK